MTKHAPFFLATFLVLCLGCTKEPDSVAFISVSKHLKESSGQRIDLSTAVPGEWDRVCIFGPYVEKSRAATALGFDWDMAANSSVIGNEGLSLLVFIKDKQVVEHFDYPRGKGDFSNLSGECFAKKDAVFVHNDQPSQGWPGLFPERHNVPFDSGTSQRAGQLKR
jgi:hypothetical protein